MISFETPQILLAVLIIILLVFIKPYEINFPKDSIYTSAFTSKKRFFILITAYIFLIIASARPVIKNNSQQPPVIILLDLSVKNRFDEAVESVNNLFAKIKNPVSVVGVSKKPYLISPPTTDYKLIDYLLLRLSKKESHSKADFKKALEYVNTRFKEPKIILALSPEKIPNIPTIIITQNNIDEILTKYIPCFKGSVNRELFVYPLIIAFILFITAHIRINKLTNTSHKSSNININKPGN